MLGIAILQPVGICSYTISSICGLGLAFIFEFDSIMEHICTIHGIKNKVSIKRLLVGYIKKSTQRLAKLSKKLQRMKKTDRRLIAEIIYSVIIILLMTISFMT